MDYINLPLHIFLGFMACTIGALPFGLVNLNVLQTSLEKNSRAAISISLGASLVEVFYGALALFAGKAFIQIIQTSSVVKVLIIAVLFLSGAFFILKRQSINHKKASNSKAFIKGIFLNLISFQVLLYWILAVAHLTTRNMLEYDFFSLLFFLIGLWLGKMAVLNFYRVISNKITVHSQVLSRNINRIIGGTFIDDWYRSGISSYLILIQTIIRLYLFILFDSDE